MTEAEHIDPHEHVDQDDSRYDGFRIDELWMATSTGEDDQEGVLYVPPDIALVYHLPTGPAMAADERRLVHLRQFAKDVAKVNKTPVRIRHFKPTSKEEVFDG